VDATTQTDCLIHEPAEVYHAQAEDYLTSHRLADFRRCPLLYRKKQLGLIADEDGPALRIAHEGLRRVGRLAG